MASPVHVQALKSKSSYKQLSSMSVESEMQSRIPVFLFAFVSQNKSVLLWAQQGAVSRQDTKLGYDAICRKNKIVCQCLFFGVPLFRSIFGAVVNATGTSIGTQN